MDRHLRTFRIIHAAMVVAALAYTAIPELVKPHTREIPDQATYLTIAIMASLSAGTLFPIRQLLVDRGWTMLEANPGDPSALLRWSRGQIITFALCESVVLYGMVLRFIGATLPQVTPFYAAGILLLLLFAPRKP